MGTEMLPSIVRRATEFGSRLAIADQAGDASYAALLDRATLVAHRLLGGRRDLDEARVALLEPPGAAYAAGQWATWMAGGVSVPLAPRQTPAEWAYVLDDSGASEVVVAPEFVGQIEPLAAARGVRMIAADPTDAASPDARRLPLPVVADGRRALMLYTSGTTSRPKGVVLAHANLAAQAACLSEAWAWTRDDRALHVLPLNHTHGVINILACALWNGACCEFPASVDPASVWARLASGAITVFMAVPTIYSRLIAAWRSAEPDVRTGWSTGAARLRLFVSGSAALPVTVLEEWRAITGHTLLERYGMTEIGMALSNPLHGTRTPGAVGSPLPGVEVRLIDEHGRDVDDGQAGEILVRGPGIFREYWGRPDATSGAFAPGGWFRTGDIASRERGLYRILGRSSVDIIKSGGEKVSALEVEAALRDHPAITDCAVVGLPDPEWGESVAAAATLLEGAALALPELRAWARGRLSAPKLPRRLVIVEALPRNALGKVVKPDLRRLFEV